MSVDAERQAVEDEIESLNDTMGESACDAAMSDDAKEKEQEEILERLNHL
jgi:hypothetical protein